MFETANNKFLGYQRIYKTIIMTNKIPLVEKIGYSFGDAAANLVWRGALAYLAIFYTDTFGISAAAAGILFLVVRLSDGVTDIIMGMIADRTTTRWGKFRPWVLWSTPFLGLFMVLCYSTPNLSPTGKLIYAYITYIGLTLAYTVNNVPYSALMGVMTSNNTERVSLSGFRFAGAFLGGLLVMGFTPRLVEYFGGGNDQQGYQYTMFLFAAFLVAMMIFTFKSTKERVVPHIADDSSLRRELWDLCKNLPFIVVPLLVMTLFFYYRNLVTGILFFATTVCVYVFVSRLTKNTTAKSTGSQRDIADLFTNIPWLILLGVGFLFMMFNGIKYAVIAYYFKYYVEYAVDGEILTGEILVGSYFIALLVVSIFAALCTDTLTRIFGKKQLFISSLFLSGLCTALMFWLPSDQIVSIFVVGCIAEFFAAVMPVLFFSLLGDAADYSEWKNGRRATGLVFSAGTFINKIGGGFAGALVLLVLASYGYDGLDESTIEGSLSGIKLLMTWIPAVFSFLAALLMCFYPLTKENNERIEKELKSRREQEAGALS